MKRLTLVFFFTYLTKTAHEMRCTKGLVKVNNRGIITKHIALTLQFHIGILCNYINESASTNSLNIRAIHLSCPVIATSPLKNAKFLK
jgi:hypothetical protein